ncbi:MAG: PadR family transcriptional regulator [Anaerolineales bacterium]|nr:PadR family transcriptional regulator [Anaerolineales bacterium]
MDGIKATKKFEKEMKSGTASLVLLSVLAKAKEPLYGYLIAKQIEADSQGASMIKQGALYPVLRSLESSGLLESQVEPSTSGPPRRYYQITESGRTSLVEWMAIWGRIQDFVEASLEGVSHD